jgi:hypothetical protein
MHASLAASARVTAATALPRGVERLRAALLWLTAFSGAFVFIEPGPYEVCALVTIVVFAATGLTLRAAIMPLVILLGLADIGFSLAVIPVLGQPKTATWVLISWYLSVTAVFYAAMLGTQTAARLELLVRGTMAAAIVASTAAIVGYFRLLPGLSDLLLLYDRARGTFNDPNVLGAFLVFPALIVLQRLIAGRPAEALRAGLLLAVFTAALLLSFSRGAWGQLAFGAILVMFVTLLTSRSPRERLRLALLAAAGLVVLAAFIAALLSIDRVADLFRERASLEQSYDVGPLGRFGRHALGFLLALDHPLGIGPLQFHTYFPEDPHNAYLNAFMSGGWLAGFSFLALVAVTLVCGARHLVAATPWRSTYVAAYAALAANFGESAIIDSDHWRHYFLLLGVVWGLMAAEGTRGRVIVADQGSAASAGRGHPENQQQK